MSRNRAGNGVGSAVKDNLADIGDALDVEAAFTSGREQFCAAAFFAIERQNVLRQSGKFFCCCATGSFASEQLVLVLERDGVHRSTVSSGSLAC